VFFALAYLLLRRHILEHYDVAHVLLLAATAGPCRLLTSIRMAPNRIDVLLPEWMVRGGRRVSRLPTG
jgi:hypothetical protein